MLETGWCSGEDRVRLASAVGEDPSLEFGSLLLQPGIFRLVGEEWVCVLA